MKKILSVLTILVLTITCFAACGNNNSGGVPGTTAPGIETTGLGEDTAMPRSGTEPVLNPEDKDERETEKTQ